MVSGVIALAQFPGRWMKLAAEQKRCTSNSFLRSSLFAAVQGKERRFMKGRGSGQPERHNSKIHG